MGNAERLAQLQQRQALIANGGATYETRNSGRGEQAVYTTGRPYPGAGVISELLGPNGDWTRQDWHAHHEDRSNSWAANVLRGGPNQGLQSYDFTFESLDRNGRPVNGSAHGLPLIAPIDSRVIDLERSMANSGGLGCFVQLEYLDSGLKVAVHHLTSVAPNIVKGGQIKGGTVFGYQGGSGYVPRDFDTHVDIVGTETAVEMFVRSNQTGDFKTRVESERQAAS
tara:strand:- start:61 stop:735 length:675 start_codon:yes stop_codon:yes gene_type:complete